MNTRHSSDADLHTLRAFMRKYSMAAEAYEAIADKGHLKTTLTVSHGVATLQNSLPPEEAFTRLVICMMEFLNPSSRLYFEVVLGILEARFADVVGPERLKSLRQAIAGHREGQLRLVVGEKTLSAEDVYKLVIAGHYYETSGNAPEVLRAAQEDPLTNSFLWLQFHSYILGGFEIVSGLFDCIRLLRTQDGGVDLLDDAVHPNRCIFCLQRSGPFAAEEHIVPESLGNNDLILPRGYVCDDCNHTTLSQLDSALVDFLPIAGLRVLYTSVTKKGKAPRATFRGVDMTKAKPGHVHIAAKGGIDPVKNMNHLPDGSVAFKMEFTSRKPFDGVGVARALYKIGLELLAYDKGHDVACGPRYNEAREFVLRGGVAVNDVLLLTECTPGPRSVLEIAVAEPGTFVSISIFGVRFLVNLERVPRLSGQDNLQRLGFKSILSS